MDHHLTAEQDAQANEWIRFGLRLGVSAALHPLEYSKVLIQLGYEPIAPRHGKSLLGNHIMVLPNIFQYAGYIRRVDGFCGMYRGLAPKLVGTIIGSMCSERIAEKLGVAVVLDESKDESELSEEESYRRFKATLERDMVLHATTIIVTHPFQVISVRMMAQFIGRETTYRSIIGSLIAIYHNEGIYGFFSGVIPKLLCDLACLALTTSSVYLLNKYLIKDKDGRQYSASFTQFVFSSILYPLNVVSSCITVSGSGLLAGKPPFMPEYNNWIDCWHDLSLRGELKRGNSLFWRSAKSQSLLGTNFKFIAPLPTIQKYK